MPRNSSGIYTLPVAAFVSGTVIKSADMNSNLSDIATALSQSIASNGVTAITAPILFTTGVVGSPGIAFIGNTTTGFYLPASNQLAITINGIQAIVWASTGATVATQFTFSSASTVNFSTGNYIFGSAANANALLTAMAQNFTLTFTIDGGGNVPATGTPKGYIEIPCNCTIVRSTLMADQSGSAVLSIVSASFVGFPPSASIVASAPPTLSTQQASQDTTLVGWTVNQTAGNILGIGLTSITTCTRLTLSLLCTRTSR